MNIKPYMNISFIYICHQNSYRKNINKELKDEIEKGLKQVMS